MKNHHRWVFGPGRTVMPGRAAGTQVFHSSGRRLSGWLGETVATCRGPHERGRCLDDGLLHVLDVSHQSQLSAIIPPRRTAVIPPGSLSRSTTDLLCFVRYTNQSSPHTDDHPEPAVVPPILVVCLCLAALLGCVLGRSASPVRLGQLGIFHFFFFCLALVFLPWCRHTTHQRPGPPHHPPRSARDRGEGSITFRPF